MDAALQHHQGARVGVLDTARPALRAWAVQFWALPLTTPRRSGRRYSAQSVHSPLPMGAGRLVPVDVAR